MNKKPHVLCTAAVAALLGAAITLAAPTGLVQPEPADPLPSWNDTAAKKAILAFVKKVTTRGSPDFVPVADRIATFDNDGTLWYEKPTVEVVFTLARLKAMAAKDPTLRKKQPFKAALEGDHEYFHKAGVKAALDLVVATHGDMSQDQFEEEARTFFKASRHPKFGVPYPQTAYRPMVELLQYLRAHGFQTWICSGGWMDLMRAMTQEAYGIPPQQVIGSSLKKKMVEKDGKYVLWILAQLLTLCDQEDKPVEIALHIGKRPVFAAGNVRSGGDIAMLRYCQGRKGPSFQLMVNHDDSKREFAYREKDDASLKAARKYGWTVVSMKDDWKKVFAFEK
jgi:phosphoserine phosphatase